MEKKERERERVSARRRKRGEREGKKRKSGIYDFSGAPGGEKREENDIQLRRTWGGDVDGGGAVR